MPRLPKISACGFFLIIFLIFASPVRAVTSINIQEKLPQQFIIKYKNELTEEERRNIHREIAAESKGVIKGINAEAVKITNQTLVSGIVRRDERIAYIEPDYQAYAQELTNDPLLSSYQWNMFQIQAASEGTSGWNFGKGSSTVAVAIVDTGIDPYHEDLKSKISASKNCTNSTSVNDYFGHGTHVAGIAAAETNNSLGVAGVGYTAKLLNAKGLGDNGSGYYSWIANCIVWAADQGARIINMSLGSTYYSKTLEDAVNYAWNKGAVIVAAAGNSNSKTPFYPAAFGNVIAVGATDKNDSKASFSNYGLWVAVSAPGVGIYSTMPGYSNALGGRYYGALSGTSMAAPMVAGLAALLMSIPDMTNIQAVNNIQTYSDRISGTGIYFKYGRINALNSLQNTGSLSVPAVTFSPTPTPASFTVPAVTATPTRMPTASPTLKPTATSTVTTKPTLTRTPTPTSYNPWTRWCSRYPFLCK